MFPDVREPDDDMHDPDVKIRRAEDRSSLSARGLANIGCLVFLCVGVLALLYVLPRHAVTITTDTTYPCSAVYPIVSHFARSRQDTFGAFNLGGTNASGQIPDIVGKFGLIDPDTPREAYVKTAVNGGEEMELVFSDEFNVDGRSFYPGDDPYWEAVNLHYWVCSQHPRNRTCVHNAYGIANK